MFIWLTTNKEALAGLASIFSVVGTAVAVVIFFSGVRQYKKAENWKKTEFLARLYSEFTNDLRAVHAIWMLDGDDRKIFFEEGDKFKPYRVNQKILYDALRRYSPEREFSQRDLHIRDSLDCFFVYIEQFDRAVENGLVEKEEVYPYFAYWIDLLNSRGDTPEDEKLRQQVLDYVKVIGYRHVERFLSRWRDNESG